MAGAGVLSLDRSNNRQGIVVMRTAAERIRAGELMCIYPEGTRSKTGLLGEFRCGCFKVPLWAEAPLAVVTVKGTEGIGKRIFRCRTEIVYTVERVFSYAEIASLTTAEMAALAEKTMRDGGIR